MRIERFPCNVLSPLIHKALWETRGEEGRLACYSERLVHENRMERRSAIESECNQNIWKTHRNIDTHKSSDLWTVVAKCDSFSIPTNGTVVDEGADVFKSAVLAHEVMQVIAVRVI